MKTNLLDIIVCPKCHSAFDLDIVSKEDLAGFEEVIEGRLTCKTGHVYPIVDGVPILLSDLDQQELRTAEIFGFEWQSFSDYSLSNLSELLYPLTLDVLSEKKILDAGCGAGRHIIEIANSAAKSVVGIDISRAADVAHKKVKILSNANIIQTDICHLPFRKENFDFIYSFGVLHHLSSPFNGFKALVDDLAPNGTILIVVYKRTFRKRFLEIIRLVTKRLPKQMQIVIAFFCTFIDYGLLIKPYKFFLRYSFTRELMQHCVLAHIKEYARHNFKVSFTDWYDRLSAPLSASFTEEEIKDWFLKLNLCDIDIRNIRSFWVRGYGRKL